MTGNTSGERMARIEEQQKHEMALLIEIKATLAEIKAAQDKDIANLAALENRGRGFLLAAGLFGSALGAVITAKLGAWFMSIAGALR